MKLLLPLLLILSSCGDDDMKKYSKLSGLRILAIEADAPQINSAQDVLITPFLSYPEANDTILDVSFKVCIDPGIAYGAEVKCATPIQTGSTTFNTNTLSTDFYTGPMDTITITTANLVAPFTYLNNLSNTIQFNGIDIIVIFTITDQADSSKNIKTFKRISLSTKASGLNTNQSFSAIQNDDANLTVFPSSIANLSISSPDVGQAYQVEGSNGIANLTETMTVSWFSNVGEFKYSRTNKDESVEFDPQGETSGVFVAVYRDNRGGVKVIKVVP